MFFLFQLAMLLKNYTGFQVSVCHAVTFPVGLLMVVKCVGLPPGHFGDFHSNSPHPGSHVVDMAM